MGVNLCDKPAFYSKHSFSPIFTTPILSLLTPGMHVTVVENGFKVAEKEDSEQRKRGREGRYRAEHKWEVGGERHKRGWKEVDNFIF